MEKPRMFLVEDLEDKIIDAATKYYINFTNEVEEFDPQYFAKLLEGPQLHDFVQTTFEKIQHLNNQEINKYLTVSLSQFKTHQPDRRYDFLKKLFFQKYWIPNDMEEHYIRMPEHQSKYFDHVFYYYDKYFHLYHEAADQVLQDFKKGYLGSFADFALPNTVQPKQKLKTNLSVKELAYLFRVLYDEEIIDSKHKTDIFNFIAENFSSKQKEDISANSIKNAFDTPDFNTVDFWQEKFTHFMQKARKDKEK
ncbi:hypothetical protein [Kaistella palustris]|uniref:hypothetical protein n=1 Tax=Kaistella palustris TaxID=493376 RepID=UPI0012EB35F9|nr:hypothetical protein [Kaistella palustris]